MSAFGKNRPRLMPCGAVPLKSLRALVEQQLRDLKPMISGAIPIGPWEMAKNASCTGYIHARAVDIVNEAFSLAGSTPVYTKSALRRRWRDVRVVARHYGGSTAQYPANGSLLGPVGAWAEQVRLEIRSLN